MWTAVTVFLFGFIIDWMYVGWTRSVQGFEIFKAGIYSILVAAPGVFGYLEIVNNRWMAIPWFLGLGLGTICSLYYFKKKKERSKNEEVRCSGCCACRGL